jgi:phage tail-like protein
MAENEYALPGFHFSVDLGGTIMNCSEVSGLDMETDVIEYRDGNSQIFTTQKMSGLQKFSDITLKKGVFVDDVEFHDWFKEVSMHIPDRKDVTISLLDEEHNAVMTWKLINAWPKKVSAPDMKSDASEVAIETIEIVHEGCELVE